MPLAYFSFLSICVLTTLDSGYIALKWFLGGAVDKSQNMLVSLVPKQMIGSPIPSFMMMGLATLGGIWAGLELEYFMVAYASFFVGYAALAIARCFVPNSQQPLPQIRMFSMASMSIVIFAFGYLNSQTLLLYLARCYHSFMASGSCSTQIYCVSPQKKPGKSLRRLLRFPPFERWPGRPRW